MTSPSNTPTHLRPARVVALTALLIVMWSSTFTTIKVALAYATPMVFAATRCLVGGAVLAAVALVLRRTPRLRAHAGAYALVTTFNVAGFIGLQTLAIQLLPSGLAAILIYLQPVITVLLSQPLLGERVGPTKVIGAAIAFAGVTTLSLGGPGGRHFTVVGIVLGAAAALCWSLGTLALKRYAGQIDPLWGIAVPFLAGGAILLSVSPAFGPVTIAWTADFGWSMLYTALIGTAASWLVWLTLLTHGDASTASVSIFLVPVLAIVFGVLLLGEALPPTTYAGAALVVLGVYLVNRRRRAVRPRSGPPDGTAPGRRPGG